MDPLRAAVPLARLLFALAERRGTRTVRVRSGTRVAVLCIADGALLALDGVDGEPLGDTLLRQGQLDPARHHAALALGAPREGLVGRWLVTAGVVPHTVVTAALREQLRARVARLLGWREPQVTMSSAAPCSYELSVPLTTAVWEALLVRAEALSPASLAAL
jgi:hypothetical protein